MANALLQLAVHTLLASSWMVHRSSAERGGHTARRVAADAQPSLLQFQAPGLKIHQMLARGRPDGSKETVTVCRATWPMHHLLEQAKAVDIDGMTHAWIVNSWAAFPWVSEAAANCTAIVFNLRRAKRGADAAGAAAAAAASAAADSSAAAAAAAGDGPSSGAAGAEEGMATSHLLSSSSSAGGGGGGMPLRRVAMLGVAGVMGEVTKEKLAKAIWGTLSIYGLHASTKMAYAAMMGYDFVLYISRHPYTDKLPPTFSKVPGLQHLVHDLGYETVLYTDWDTWISPHAIAPVEAMMAAKPGATLYLQEWENHGICNGVFLLRNTPMGRRFLETWWRWASEGCCPLERFPRDQLAFQHIVRAMLHDEASMLAGDPWVEREKLFSGQVYEGPETGWIAAAQRTASVGVISWKPAPAEVYGPMPGVVASRVQLTSCAGLWKEGEGGPCLPMGVTALIHHTGGAFASKCCDFYKPILTQILMDLRIWGQML